MSYVRVQSPVYHSAVCQSQLYQSPVCKSQVFQSQVYQSTECQSTESQSPVCGVQYVRVQCQEYWSIPGQDASVICEGFNLNVG